MAVETSPKRFEVDGQEVVLGRVEQEGLNKVGETFEKLLAIDPVDPVAGVLGSASTVGHSRVNNA